MFYNRVWITVQKDFCSGNFGTEEIIRCNILQIICACEAMVYTQYLTASWKINIGVTLCECLKCINNTSQLSHHCFRNKGKKPKRYIYPKVFTSLVWRPKAWICMVIHITNVTNWLYSPHFGNEHIGRISFYRICILE